MDLQVVTCSYSEFRPDMGQPVRISLGAPRWWKEPIPSWSALWSLTPRRDYLYASDEVYIEKYTAQLERHGVPEIVGDFERIAERAQKDTLVLMCWRSRMEGGVTGRCSRSGGCRRRGNCCRNWGVARSRGTSLRGQS
jgi:hypothetical protein